MVNDLFLFQKQTYVLYIVYWGKLSFSGVTYSDKPIITCVYSYNTANIFPVSHILLLFLSPKGSRNSGNIRHSVSSSIFNCKKSKDSKDSKYNVKYKKKTINKTHHSKYNK